jgi:N-acetylmuramate 1-kinase
MVRTREALIEVIVRAAIRLTGGHGPTVTTLRQDASNRSYHRVIVQGGAPRSLVVMELGDARPEEATGGTAPSELPFLNVQRYLEAGGLGVPRVFEHDRAHGLIYLEDLGDVTMESVVSRAEPSQRQPYYRAAVETLARFQEYSRVPGSCEAFGRRFDYDLLRWELDHFREWLLEAQRGIVLAGSERLLLDAAFDVVARELAQAPALLVHRDFQSRNLMVQERTNTPVLRLIDFQDALVGPLPYDLVALLRDSYVDLELHEVDAAIDHYLSLRPAPHPPEVFRRLFDLQTVQRKLKDAGRFVFIERRKGNASFLPFIAPSLRYVREALERLPDLADLRALLGRRLEEFDPPPSPTGTLAPFDPPRGMP